MEGNCILFTDKLFGGSNGTTGCHNDTSNNSVVIDVAT
jgi:hypothetical protein